jgi:hypothetical protein
MHIQHKHNIEILSNVCVHLCMVCLRKQLIASKISKLTLSNMNQSILRI